MKDKELTDIGQQVAKRGRPKDSGGNERKDLSWNGNENLLPGDRGRYLRHALASWDLPEIDISDEKQVEERIIWYFNHCVEDDIKPTVSGMCNALGIDRKTFYTWQVGEYRESTHRPIVKKRGQFSKKCGKIGWSMARLTRSLESFSERITLDMPTSRTLLLHRIIRSVKQETRKKCDSVILIPWWLMNFHLMTAKKTAEKNNFFIFGKLAERTFQKVENQLSKVCLG